MCSIGTCSNICAYYSAVGVLFTFWVGVMISKQAFFIAGVDDPDTMGSSAWGAMVMFICTFALSIYGMYHDSASKEVDGVEAVGAEGYQLNTGANDYGSRYD